MTANSTRQVDVVIVGAGAAGLSAALILGRARRQVLVLDSGPPRNAPAQLRMASSRATTRRRWNYCGSHAISSLRTTRSLSGTLRPWTRHRQARDSRSRSRAARR
ncbi:MAG: FAD-dependent oxidoreductase [Dehalococcoidia bacterium]|nr:FAD-dependent oxidoreductase [Dehalococcoidia bacterium]